MDTLLNKISFQHSRTENGNYSLHTQHFHSSYELFFFLGGNVEYVVGDAKYLLQPYDLLYIQPTVFHHPKVSPDKPYERFVINFQEEIIPENLRALLQTGRTHYRFADNPYVKNLYDGLDGFTKSASPEESLAFCLQTVNLLLLQFKYAEQSLETKTAIHPTLSAILRYIDEHLFEPLGATEIAQKFFVSPSWLFHIFQKHMHLSYTSYVNKKKAFHSQQLIRSGVPPTQAAIECGFSEYTTFYRQYKKLFGHTPQADK